MAKRNFDVPLVDAFGEQFVEMKFIKDKSGKKIKDPTNPSGYQQEEANVSISTPIINSLYASLEMDREIDGVASNKLHSLAQRIREGGLREYTMEELVEIKQRVHKSSPRIVYARVCEVVDAEPEQIKIQDNEAA